MGENVFQTKELDALARRLGPIEDNAATLLDGLGEQPPETLFHYAAPDALQGMLKGASIWASNALFLNDRSELFYVNEVIATAAKSLRAEATAPASKRLLEVLSVPEWRRYESRDVFVACFSANPDSLSQWRAYANDGLGYAAGFSTSSKFSVRGRPEARVQLVKVLYDSDSQQDVVRDSLRRIVEAVNGCNDSGETEAIVFRGMLAVNLAIVPVAVALKNPGFSEESEWRLVVIEPLSWPRGLHMRHRPGPFGITPFVELEAGEKLPLRKVVLGPRLHENPARAGLISLLMHHKYDVVGNSPDKVAIQDSEATYRGRWEG